MENYETFPELSIKYKDGTIEKIKVTGSKDSYNVLKRMYDADMINYDESAIVIYLNRALETIGWMKISQGGLSGTVIDIRKIMATALLCGAHYIILSHNHPSGSISPSESDITITKQLVDAGKLMMIELIDHLIVTKDKYYSFRDECLI